MITYPTKIRKDGHSAVITIPKPILKELNLYLGDTIEIIIQKKQKKLTINTQQVVN